MPPPPELPRGPSRRAPLLLLVIAAALLVARIGSGVWEGRHPPDLPDRMPWHGIASAEADSRASGRLVLYDFSAAWCGPCRQMATEVFADETSARKLGAMFVPVHVVDRAREDGRNQPDVQALEDRFRIEAFPTLVVYAPDTGRHVTITGYGGAASLMQELTQATLTLRTGGGRRDSL